MSKKIRYHFDPPHVHSRRIEEIDMQLVYEYKVICAWCSKHMATKTSDDPKMEGQESHSICATCKEAMENA